MVKIQDASASSGPETDDPDAASIEAAMRVPVTVTLGPMGTLLRKLHSLMAPGQSLAPDLLGAEEVCLLSDSLKKLCISLKNMSEDEDPSFMVQWWMKIVRELCYDTEDHLDEVCRAGTHHDFSDLLARAEDASESRQCFEWSPPKTIKPAEQGGAGVSRRTSPELQVPLPVHVEPPNKLVELLGLHSDGKTLKVIPITGCAGVGKTTAARALYHRHGGKFQCQAFVTVSRNPDMRGFLTSILSQLKAPRPHGFPDVPDLIDAIHKHLQGKRYFIVVDDLWTSSVWNIISRAFPRGDYCSRIITTTQIDDVALACCSYDPVYMYKMFPLNDPESRKLFFGIVFGSEDGCPIDIKEVSYDIVKKCSGLPLAVVNIARLLASESNIVRERWEHIQDSLPSTSEEMMDVLNLLYNILPHLMYNSLPPRLRTCLLYLSMYSEGHVIKKDELVKLWVTEGFLSAVGGRNTQEIAEGYFDELVGRGMVQAVDINNNGEVLSCTVHQMVLDFIRLTSVEENFVINVDCFQSTLALPDKVHRLSVQFGGVKGAYIPESIITSQVRSLIFWGFFKCVPSIMDCRLLRILILRIWDDEDNESFDLTGIGELFLLKYLEIDCNITVKLPETDNIPWLQHLETLHVDARLSAVPSDIINMKRLLQLRLPSEYILPSIVAKMTSLRTLGYFDVSSYTVGDVLHLGELTNLQDLQLTCSTVQPAENLERNMQLLGSILEKLTVLQSLTLVPAASDSSCVNIPKDGFNMACPPPDLLLQRIELSRRCCIFFSLPNWFGELMKLRILKIAISKLSMNDADMLKGLPALTALTLYIQTVSEERIVIDKGGFRVLTYFKFMCNAPCLSFVQGAMPKVQKLKLGFSSNEWRSHTFETVGICHLTGLTEVSLKFRARGADEFDIKAAESKLEAAVSNHPNTLVIRVHCVDVIFYAEEDKSTATEGIEEQRQEIQEGKRKITECSKEREENRQEINVDKKRRSEIWEVRDENISWEQHVNMQVESRYARTDLVSTPLKHHTQSVNVVTGAMGSLLPKLLELLKDEYNLEAKVKDSVESLHKELEGMQDDLWIVAKLKQKELDDVTRIWAKQVRDLSYDAEDVIDSLPLCVKGSRGGTHRHITGVTELLARQEIADAIDGIMKQAQDLAARRDSQNKIGLHIAANPNAAANIDHPLSALYKDPKDMVGIEVPRDEVIMKLTDEAGDVFKQLRIISIVGMGGLGKTTLAKAVYDKIKVQYDCTAFVLVSRDPDMRKVYMDILLEIGKQKYMDHNLAKMDERQLIDEITGLLANKRYLIVCDDIWDANSWEVIKLALIDNGLGSRVITTTRILEVAINASDVYRLKALSDSHSEELFNTRLFGGKDNVPHDVPRVPEKLLQKCGGVSLAIIRMASLLVGKPTDDFYNNIDFWSRGEGNADVDNARKILLSSYYDLPYHLRACLLHLHIFPDDCLIKKETLIWKWAAEGLIVEEPLTGRGLFEIGEGYLKELINRNVAVSVEDDSCPGKVTGCRVHDLVFEMICYLSTEENFVTVLDGSEQYPRVESKARRIAVQKWAAQLADPLANIRPESLRSFNTTGCHFRMELSLARFELLRVIAIEECSLFEDNLSSSSLRNKGNCSRLKHLGKLHLLRYLGLYNTRIDELPEEIGDLIYLQTLDLRGTRISEKLPWTVSQLRQLKCLRIDRYIAVPDWMGRLTSLEELRLGYVRGSKNFLKELGRLTELRELEIWIDELDENQNKALVESMRKLEKIQVLRVRGSHWSSSAAALNWGELHPYGQMHELRLNIASRLPAWINISRVPMLSYLSLHVKAVEQKDLDILGALPELITLDLVMWSNAFLSIKGFPKLRRIHTSSTFMFLPGAMPRLESLHFEIDVPALKYAKVNFDHDLVASTLGNLLSLEKLEVRIRSTVDYFEAMRKSVERAVDKHPNRPSFHVSGGH